MRAWLYYRLSRDEDKELNSLTNQKNILVEYAENNGYTVVGESFDDNVSGMHFNREGIEKIYDEVEKKTIDAVIVKDLSRLGRHKTQTALFIDYLREHDVRVLSVTENIDTSNEDDELMVGFKGIFNDMYCRDISKKIRAGYKQKQKQGIVLIPPMGYFKDKNTGEVVIVEEQASIVRRIFDLYLSGYGIKAIAKILNAEGIKSQGYYQQKLLGKKLGYNNITSRKSHTASCGRTRELSVFCKMNFTAELSSVTDPTPARSIISARNCRRKNTTGMKTLCLLSYQERYGSRHNFYSATMWNAMSAPDRTRRTTAIRG